MPATVTVAVCQFSPTSERAANRTRITQLVADAADAGARLVVLPEYASYFIDPIDDTFAGNAEAMDGEFVGTLRHLATLHDLVIVAGLVERAEDGRAHNTVVAVNADGLLATHRKQHLYDAFGQTESTWLAPGELGSPAVFELDGLRFGMMTCYDLRFPEVARTLVDAGAEVLVVPAEWVRGALKEHHWNTLLAARAIESTCYVIAADHPGPIGIGLSQVIDPQGVVVAGVSAGEGMTLAALQPELIARTRAVNPVLALRRYRVVPRD